MGYSKCLEDNKLIALDRMKSLEEKKAMRNAEWSSYKQEYHRGKEKIPYYKYVQNLRNMGINPDEF